VEAPVKYVILLYRNPMTRQFWEELSDAEKAEAAKGHVALGEELAASGELIVTEALADLSEGRRVLVQRGQTVTTDGPFAEAKEHLAGFYLVDCDSFERAVEHAARLPEAEFGLVEVRPVLDLGSLGE
jgi:hypothetical protein